MVVGIAQMAPYLKATQAPDPGILGQLVTIMSGHRMVLHRCSFAANANIFVDVAVGS